MAERVLILGASARAAAASTRRAGFEPFVIDLFADRDTRQLAECLRCPLVEYPDGLFRLARQLPPMPWFYTGGLENEPELIGASARERELRGTGADALRQVRNPFRLAERLAQHGIPHPELLRLGVSPRHPGPWLRKPVRGSAGAGIRFATPAELADPEDGFFLQQFLPGTSGSTLFFGASTGAILFGSSTQLIGTDWLHARPFQYSGSIVQTQGCSPEIASAANLLTTECGVRGLFGIDWIRHAGRSYLIEVNPRYPASTEVIEFATERVCLSGSGGEFPARNAVAGTVGKAIYYAPHPLTVPATGPWEESVSLAVDVWRRPDYADIPHPGDVIERGQPVLTILAEAANADNCLARLQIHARELDQLFGYVPVSGESECPR